MLSHLVERILRQRELHIPKDAVSSEYVREIVGPVLRETSSSWHIPCQHRLNNPAQENEIIQVERTLGHPLPDPLRTFLQITNGARLYEVPGAWIPDWVRSQDPQASYVRYHIFGTAELITVNQRLFASFRNSLGDDPEFHDTHTLNYVAFCDAHNGNYLAIVHEGEEGGIVFFLDKEYQFRPYSKQDTDLYYTVSQSFESWLEQIANTNGWGGFYRNAGILDY